MFTPLESPVACSRDEYNFHFERTWGLLERANSLDVTCMLNVELSPFFDTVP
jgi:hypothetical protein